MSRWHVDTCMHVTILPRLLRARALWVKLEICALWLSFFSFSMPHLRKGVTAASRGRLLVLHPQVLRQHRTALYTSPKIAKGMCQAGKNPERTARTPTRHVKPSQVETGVSPLWTGMLSFLLSLSRPQGCCLTGNNPSLTTWTCISGRTEITHKCVPIQDKRFQNKCSVLQNFHLGARPVWENEQTTS